MKFVERKQKENDADELRDLLDANPDKEIGKGARVKKITMIEEEIDSWGDKK
jgi:hypothetical protein